MNEKLLPTTITLKCDPVKVHEQYLNEQLPNTIKLFGHEYVLIEFRIDDGKQCTISLELVEEIINEIRDRR